MKNVVWISLCFAGMAAAETVYWQSSTDTARWVDKGSLQSIASDNGSANEIRIDHNQTYQEIDGWGGCFNEKGWDAMSGLSVAARNEVLQAFFDPNTGCKFNICRVPMGASDYSMNSYSLNDTAGDYAMNNFSLVRDREKLIPFVKAAMVYRPDLKVWGSPWSPPPWMKNNNAFNGGRMKQDAQNLNAYALYFQKFVQGYRSEGIDLYAVHVQNEPIYETNYPSCLWSGEELRDFIKNNLGPQFQTNNINAEIWLGTMADSDYSKYAGIALSDSTANSFITGVGYQWGGKEAVEQTRDNHPGKRIMQTETECGNHENDWNYADHTWGLMKLYLDRGVNSYMQWNMVLDETGLSTGNWAQCSPVVVDKNTQQVTYTPQFFATKHFSYYVKPGARRISTSGSYGDRIGFVNPNGEVVLVVKNSGGDTTTPIYLGDGQMITVALPAHSFHTFRFTPPPSPPFDPYVQIEAENFTTMNGISKEPCSEGGQDVGYIQNNDSLVFKNVEFGAGAGSFTARVASNGSGGNIEIRLDSLTGPLAGTCTVTPTGDWQSWVSVACPIHSASGTHDLYLVFTGGSGYLFNLNWFKFASSAVTVVTPSFSPAGGNYPSAQSVTISTTTSGATIRYTTDGSTPTSTTGTLYSGPVQVSTNTTLKAIAYKSGMTDSGVATAAYVINTGGGPPVASSITDYLKDDFVAVSRSKSGGANIVNSTDGNFVNNVQDPGNVFRAFHPDPIINTGWHFERNFSVNGEWIEYVAPTGYVFNGVSVRVLTNGISDEDKDTCLTAFAGASSASVSSLSLTRATDTSNNGGSDGWVSYIFSNASFAGQKHLRIYLNPLESGAAWKASVDTVTLALISSSAPPAITYEEWLAVYDFAPTDDTSPSGDPDHDGIPNVIEHVYGTVPNQDSSGNERLDVTAGVVRWTHPLNAAIASDVIHDYQWSADLIEWNANGAPNTSGTKVSISTSPPANGKTTASATVTQGAAPRLFIRIVSSGTSSQPLTNGCYFPKKYYTYEALPSYSMVSGQLPEPVLPSRPELQAMYWKCWELAFSHLKQPQTGAGSPLVSNWLDDAFSPNIYQWDTCFMMMFSRYGHFQYSTIQSLDNFYSRQRPSGYICREYLEADGAERHYGDNGGYDDPNGWKNTINPPIFAWAETETFKVTGDQSRFAAVLPALEKYVEWLNRDGLPSDTDMDHSGRRSTGTAHGLYWNTGLGCGMDNTPKPTGTGAGWVDMSCQMVMQYNDIAIIYRQLGQTAKAIAAETEASAISGRINQWCWDETDGFYYDIDAAGTKFKKKTSSGFWPLIAGVASPSQAARLVDHLKNPSEFWRPFVFPTLAANEPEYRADGDYWVGGVWAPTNYMIIKGLERYGYHSFAAEASEKYIAGMAVVFQNTGTVWENYAPESFNPGNRSAGDFVGWSGCGPIALYIENVLGFHPNGVNNTLTWNLRLQEAHGIKRLQFGATRADLIYDGNGTVSIDSNRAFTLVLNGTSHLVPLGTRSISGVLP